MAPCRASRRTQAQESSMGRSFLPRLSEMTLGEQHVLVCTQNLFRDDPRRHTRQVAQARA